MGVAEIHGADKALCVTNALTPQGHPTHGESRGAFDGEGYRESVRAVAARVELGPRSALRRGGAACARASKLATWSTRSGGRRRVR